MSYDSTTSVPENKGERGIIKQVDLTDSDTFPYTIWIPPENKKVVVDDILLTLREASGNRAIFNLEIRKAGQWETMMQIAQVGNGVAMFGHGFIGKISSEIGNGTAPKVRVHKPITANTTNFTLKVLVIGRNV